MHVGTEALVAGLDHIRKSPQEEGLVEMIVRRPSVGRREILVKGTLSTTQGLEGDRWWCTPSSSSPDGSANPDKQLTLINARLSSLIADGDEARRALAEDQLHVDLDLSIDNLPPGTRLAIGAAVVEVTAAPHTGCVKFANRFGKEALRFVNVGEGKQLRLRGMNTRVVQGGPVEVGDAIRKL
jgi:hypothetical protein